LLINLFNSHTHIALGAPTSPPQPLLTSAILSKKVKVG